MEINKATLKELIRERYNQFREIPIPKGFHKAAEAFDSLRFYEYDGYISGFASSCVNGVEKHRFRVKIDETLRQQIQDCQEELDKLKYYYQKLDELAHLAKQYYDESD
jgi:hypothetical protein